MPARGRLIEQGDQ